MQLQKATTKTIHYPSRRDISPILLTLALSLSASANPPIDVENNQREEIRTPVESVESIQGYEPPYISPVEEIADKNCTASLPTPPIEEQNQTTVVKPRRLMGKVAR